ncbi:polyhydroxyalkanoate synthesis repressor PhaR [Hyphomonas johnsonii]|jgi:polyhydroxyalkanoate synthesis repressor PhaR|uniref:Polyhydroxyalkanoate synthesis repressor PhaR n=1 Tax=Hyphomonas johnsonii MHS-2 TaxID=1280950 RepID=A0A059FNS0_9PROT|nr:polyhydroxyalkanoate synthesis repressor PhaR [Hyphomonas johnsonii]KCZ92267.1 polyhydroxyalkanoate synthesis repressor PhaR [Hyphomonas johnsonii MHS-2]
MAKTNGSSQTIIIKKYANRRLYDTSTSSYVTLDHLSELVREGRDFEVRDAKTGDDLTRQVLTQIIFEQETKGEGALPLNFLRQLIGFYGGGAQTFLPAFLDMSMNSFADTQKEWRKAANPMSAFEKQAKRNMAMFEQGMKMFMPTLYKASQTEKSTPSNPILDFQAEALAAMQAQMQAIQDQLADLTKKD